MWHFTDDLYSLIPFALLTLAILGLWVHRFVWISALAAAIAAGCFTEAIGAIAIGWFALLLVLALVYRWASTRAFAGALAVRIAAGVLFFAAAVAIALLRPRGFPATVLAKVPAMDGGMSFLIVMGFAKVVSAIFILGIINPVPAVTWRELGTALVRAAPIFLITLVVVAAFAWGTGYVALEPRWTTLFLPWAFVNLFFTCFAEEAFFRGFLLHEL